MMLAHAVEGKVKRAYLRGDGLRQYRELAQAWADYCAGGAIAPDEWLPKVTSSKSLTPDRGPNGARSGPPQIIPPNDPSTADQVRISASRQKRRPVQSGATDGSPIEHLDLADAPSSRRSTGGRR